MALKKHHRWVIGSFSSIVIAFMVISALFMYSLFVQQAQNYEALSDKISGVQIGTQTQINLLTENLMQTQETLETSQESLEEELSLLKASAGEDFSGIVEQAVRSVVTIRTDSGQGTGFIINRQGYVVTNAHVLADETGYLASNIRAITYDRDVIHADFIGFNGDLDIALLAVNGSFEELDLGNSNKVQVGEKVVAIGNPLGLQFSVTEGIVSGVHREGINGIEAYIQTDAALNPGNSGGPLINKQGEVIGINNFKISSGENLGFALESNYIKDAVNDIALDTLNQNIV